MRVVVDANVFVSGAIQKGPSFRIVQRWLNTSEFDLVMCPELLAEITDVLTERPRLRKWIALATASEYIQTITTLADLVPDPTDIVPVTRDVKDDYLVALAREHAVDFIVTGDKDLLEWGNQTPPVVTPAAFEKLLD